MATTSDKWRVRGEDGAGEGRVVDFHLLTQAIGDGAWSEAAQAYDPGAGRWRLIGDPPQLQEFLPLRPLYKAKPAEEAQTDMTPMIDVTFQLIIFFMITATFVVQKTLDMPAATPEQQQAPSLPTLTELAEQNIIVRIRDDGSITVDGELVEMDALPKAIEAASEKNPDNVELILDVDDEVDYEVVVQVIDGAAGAEIEKVHFLRHVSSADGGETS